MASLARIAKTVNLINQATKNMKWKQILKFAAILAVVGGFIHWMTFVHPSVTIGFGGP
jgi:hypothetical protein